MSELKNFQSFSSISSRGLKDQVKHGQSVFVTILKGGYWTDSIRGTFLGWTPKGRVRVRSRRGVRSYSPDNIEIRDDSLYKPK